MSRVIDLTLTLTDGDKGVRIEPARILEKDGWNANTLHLYSHCGTHMDAPVHFGAGPDTIEKIPVNRFASSAWVVDVRAVRPREVIGVAHLGAVKDKLEPGESLLLCTGWSARYGSPEYRDDMPRVGLDLASFCVERKVNMLGVEPPSVADVNNLEELTAVHKVLFEGGVIVVEGLTNLQAVTKAKVTFMAFPLKIANGDGAPARALAIEEH